MKQYRQMIYGSKQNLSGKVINYISSQTEQRFKSYEQKRRADWRKRWIFEKWEIKGGIVVKYS